MTTRIAINGFGRIGRCVARVLLASKKQELELVAINDLTSPEVLAHLLSFDTVHGRFGEDVGVAAREGAIAVGDRVIPVYAEKEPSKLPWKQLAVDVVLECTGLFRDRKSASEHLKAGAKRVIISAPAESKPGEPDIDGTFCVGINTDQFDPQKHYIVSNASCTTNCLAPMAKVLDEHFGIQKGHMVTVHSYTNDQRLLDLPHKDLRRARAAAESMIPSSTGAAKAIGLVLPNLKGKLDGTAIRVPTPNVSLTCLTALVRTATTKEQVNQALRDAAQGPLRGVLAFEPRPLVSSDYMSDAHSCTIDAQQTQVVGGDLVEVHGWYDNEWGFSNRMVDLARMMGSAR